MRIYFKHSEAYLERTSPSLNRPWLYLAHVASINLALKYRMVSY